MAARKKAGTTARKQATKRVVAKRGALKRSSSRKSTVEKTSSAKRSVPQKGVSKRSTPVKKAASVTPSDSTVVSLTEYKRKRDFTKTREPAGAEPGQKPAKKKATKSRLRFIIQKHAASHLHFDLRIELDGVMKSWAVPKGPSIDPAVKRLAMQVEDHPIEYNTFEGTIPDGEYGGGTVMLWDTGTYAPDTNAMAATGKSRLLKVMDSASETGELSEEDIARDAYERGDFKIIFSGKRMQGTYVLVRTRGFGSRNSSKPSWLLIKHRDEYAKESPQRDLVETYTTSVTTDRTMEEIRDA